MKYVGYFLVLASIFTCSASCKKESKAGPGPGTLKFIGINKDSGAYNSTITIYADNFSTDKDTIKLNGVPCPVVNIQGSNIVITIPKGAGTGYFTITDGTTILKGPLFSFNYTSYVTTIAGSLDNGSIDGAGPAATFFFLNGIVVNSAGALYTTEFSDSSRVRNVNAAGVVTTFAGNGHYGFNDGSASVAEFEQLTGIAIDASGNLYVSDYYNQRIRKITPSGDVTTFAGNGKTTLQDGPADSASFNGPTGLAVDNAGNVYVADNGNFAVRRISTDGMVTTLTATGFVALTNPGQSHSPFAFPWALCLDPHGNLLLGDNGFIWKITPGGTLTVFAGAGPGFANGPANNAQFGRVEGLVADSHGNVYAADIDNDIIRQISPFGVTTFAGIVGQSFRSTDGPWQTAQFISAQGLAIDKDGNIYVADDYSVRKIFVQ